MYPVDVLIATYNRSDYLKRILDFFNEYGRDFYYIIGDSSSPIIKSKNKKLIKKYKDLKILYLDKLPDDYSLHTKLAQMTKYIKQEYCVFCPDDDFIFPNSIKKCVDFLAKNSEYVCAQGDYIGYHQTLDMRSNMSVLWKKRYTSKTLNSSTIKRFESHMRDYRMVLWSTRRSSTVKKIYKDLLKADFSKELLFNFGELLPDVLTVIQGKIKRIDCLYGVRQYFGSIHSYFLSFKDAKKQDKFESEYQKFKLIIQNNFESRGLKKSRSSKIIDTSMNDYIKFSNDEHLVNNIVFVMNKLPEIFLRIFRNLHANYIFNKAGSKEEFDKFIFSSKYNQKLFNQVKEFLNKHN